MSQRRALVWLVACLLVAAALRLPDLTTYPPGPHYDEAADGLLAGDVGLRGARPIFIPSYTGKEVLFFYLTGGLMRLLGQSLFSLRLASAFFGLLTVAAAYRAGRELIGDRRVALLGAALLAVSFWHLLFSRLGLRSISQPLLQALTLAALYRSLRSSSFILLAAAGVLLGLTAYTYLAARLFPLPLVVACLPLLGGDWGMRGFFRRDEGGKMKDERQKRPSFILHPSSFILFWGVALFIVSPLLVYFVQHPETFWVRISQVAPAGDAPLTIPQGYLKALGMLFVEGDPYWRFNLPGRPLFNGLWGGLLVVGWLVCLGRWRRATAGWQRSAYLFLAVLPLFMLLPTALATREILPSNLRAIGLIPFIFYLPALGLWFVGQSARLLVGQSARLLVGQSARLPRASQRLARQFASQRLALQWGEIVIALVLVVGGWATAGAYFGEWATRADVYYESDADLAALSRYLDQTDVSGMTVYVGALHYRHPTVAFMSQRYGQVKWLPGSQALVFPAAGPALYLFPRSSPTPDWGQTYLLRPLPVAGFFGPDDRLPFQAYLLDESPGLFMENPAEVNFGNVITLLGYNVSGTAAGSHVSLTLYWRVDGPPAAGLRAFVHLEDGWGYRWGQVEPDAYPSEQWMVGETMIQRVEVAVRPGTPPGSYRLRLGWFAPGNGRRLPHLDDAGRYAGDAFVIENVAIAAGPIPNPLPAPPIALNVAVRPELQLLGYERATESVGTGETLWLALWWQASAPLPPLVARLEARRPDDTPLILADTQPVHNTYPFTDWVTPQLVIDHVTTQIAADFPAGTYPIWLRLLDASGETLYTADLGPLTVTATERLYSPPPMTYPLAATFGGEIALLGYDLAAGEQPGAYQLTLVWQAVQQPAADYTVFVHVLDANGVCCLWQSDAMPRQGAYPTGRWLPGEVVVDEYTIQIAADLPPGDYPLEVGLYVAEDGRRLLMEMTGVEPGDALWLRPVRVERE
ncbi:MAG: glycosyltransferase family 39 protein [Chloroflexota bacterium]